MNESITLNFKSTSTYLDWNATSIGTRYQYHADGTRFNGELSYLVQEVNKEGKLEIDSDYYGEFSKVLEAIAQKSFSESETVGNRIYFIDTNKDNKSTAVSYFKYNLISNKLSESQVFHYQDNELTSRTLFVHESRKNGEITKSERFDVNDKLVERNTFSYFSSGEKCQTEKSTFNSRGEVSHKDKKVYKPNGDLFSRVQSNYNNEGIFKGAKLTYYSKGAISLVIEGECSADGKAIIDGTGKVYDITTGEITNDINYSDSMNGEINNTRLKKQVNESKISEQGSKSNSSHPGASTPAPAETKVKSELLNNKPIKHYEIIDGERFLVTKNGPVVDNGTRVQEARRGNSRFIADITSEYQNGNVVSKTTKVREVDPVTQKHSVTGEYETEYTYDSENKLDYTFTRSDFYGPGKKKIGLREQYVKNGEIFYDASLRYQPDGSVSRLFLNSYDKYEYTSRMVAGEESGQPSVRQSRTVRKTGLPIPLLKSDAINPKATPTAVINGQPPERLKGIVPDRGYPMSSSHSDAINSKATPTAEYPGQLANAINSFSDGERALAPAPVENAVHGSLGPRSLVPVMNYASQL
ncbi:hypothetical protein [Yersinia enterocolitica]|uniref:hypothetical protein n=1 Tax=Yersinia enterocolitica TaxID=630 RepID=UPI003D0307FA